jgi:hypothetical protein
VDNVVSRHLNDIYDLLAHPIVDPLADMIAIKCNQVYVISTYNQICNVIVREKLEHLRARFISPETRIKLWERVGVGDGIAFIQFKT